MNFTALLMGGVGIYMLLDDVKVSYELTNTMMQGLIFVSALAIYIIYAFLFRAAKVINNREYKRQGWLMGSYANNVNQTEGHRFTDSSLVKSKMKESNKRTLFIDKFKFDLKVVNKLSLGNIQKKIAEKSECFIDPSDMRQGSLSIGQMGSGKSQFNFNILTQNETKQMFARTFTFDSKGEYYSIFANKRKDINLNILDERGAWWDIFKENETSPLVAETFFATIFKAQAGGKKDYFSAAMQDRFTNSFKFIAVNNPNASSKDKFKMWMDELELYFLETQGKDSKSEKDVSQSMKLIMSFFAYMSFLAQNDRKSFTFNDYYSTRDIKIFATYKDDQSEKLMPYYSALLAVNFQILLSREDQNDDNLSFFNLDEFLTFANAIEYKILEGFLTRGRSKGACIKCDIQYLKSDQESAKISQLLLSSISYFYIFGGVDEETLHRISETVGKVRYRPIALVAKTQKDLIDKDVKEEALFSDVSIFHDLAAKYEHITFIPKQRVLYKGYTPVTHTTKINEYFIISTDYDNFEKEYYKTSRR